MKRNVLLLRELRELQAQDPKANRKKKRKEVETDGGVVSNALQEMPDPTSGADKSGRDKRHKKK